MEYKIRELKTEEYNLLADFLYEAIFQRERAEPLPRSVIEQPELDIYIRDFGKYDHDHCLCAETDGRVVGAVWVRIIDAFGHLDSNTPEFAISTLPEYRGFGIGTRLMEAMLAYLKRQGYEKTSLAVQKDNYALRMYQHVGFRIIDENEEEYIMCRYFRAGAAPQGTDGGEEESR